LTESSKAGPASHRLFAVLPMMPRFTIEGVWQKRDASFPTANAAVDILEDVGIVTEMTGQEKIRRYSYQPCVEMPTRCFRSERRGFEPSALTQRPRLAYT